MAGNIADKARYAYRNYDIRRGGGCDWYVAGETGVEYKLKSCVYDKWGANSPAKVVRVLGEEIEKAGIKPKGYVEPTTMLEKYEGEMYEKEEEYTKPVGPKPNIKPKKETSMILAVAIVFFGLWYFLFGRLRRK